MTNKLKELRKAKGLTQQQLAELANIDTSYVSRLETGKRGKGKGGKGGLTFVKIKALADALGVLPEDLVDPETLAQVSSEAATRATSPNASFPPIHHNLGSDDWIPVRGQTVGGANGKFVLNGQDVGRVFCPPDLLGVKDAYAVRIYGTSMEPRYRPGETIWINPLEPIRAGDDVVVQILTDDESQPESYIKEFISRSSRVLRLLQLNPEEGEPKVLEFPDERVFSIHKVVFHAKA